MKVKAIAFTFGYQYLDKVFIFDCSANYLPQRKDDGPPPRRRKRNPQQKRETIHTVRHAEVHGIKVVFRDAHHIDAECSAGRRLVELYVLSSYVRLVDLGEGDENEI